MHDTISLVTGVLEEIIAFAFRIFLLTVGGDLGCSLLDHNTLQFGTETYQL
jgi:hypothetical protein